MIDNILNVRCHYCGKFMSFAEKPAYVEEFAWNSYDPHGGDPPEHVPVHRKCLTAPALPVTPEDE